MRSGRLRHASETEIQPETNYRGEHWAMVYGGPPLPDGLGSLGVWFGLTIIDAMVPCRDVATGAGFYLPRRQADQFEPTFTFTPREAGHRK